ncbi:hypothetical protein QU481_03860 [Crenobacter sp. SG2303]|uniref:TubC N-terminal docking domain-containing protein n=1 Tax=Crenobacter oryzisoli TaxID=3056844 RepID=A0ABT7XJR0_9NEIS|nr:hypothetical protein [Crenobacter sp. SG2303]MDN0074024.1 hypothetical protein [Crenobacter sp. SG2303]
MNADIATAAELIFEARKDGLVLLLIDESTVRAQGPQATIARYRDRIRANKPALLAYLRQCQAPEEGLRPVGDFTAAVATSAALGLPAADPAGVARKRQHDDPALHPTHRTTAPLLFHQPGTGPFVIAAGAPLHVFPSLFAAKTAELPDEIWEGLGEWAFKKNVEKGYCAAWIAGDLRGVHPDHLEELS